MKRGCPHGRLWLQCWECEAGVTVPKKEPVNLRRLTSIQWKTWAMTGYWQILFCPMCDRDRKAVPSVRQFYARCQLCAHNWLIVDEKDIA